MAQCGEFSFLLARLGRRDRAVDARAFHLILAGAAASTVVAPQLHTSAGRRCARSNAGSPRAALAAEPSTWRQSARRHAVICGYGDVAS